MTWDERLNNVFDYIEKHLTSDIDLDKVACIMYQSKESFLRTFSLIMNISIYEYIRKRRMTLAAQELQNNSIKIIDLAMKYGYESPEAFTRAFKVIHGMSPSAARKKGVKLSLYPRISFLITVKGDIKMDAARYLCALHLHEKSLYELAMMIKDFIGITQAIYVASRMKVGLRDTSEYGGFYKDFIYLQGYFDIKNAVERNPSIYEKLYYGRIALDDIKRLNDIISDAMEVNAINLPRIPN
ncbi:MAG TPA: helix-turn-helix domain-containing protein [Lachnospiraceae bacterium]|nr:helix-turn-helix domain-containing protein [Lachnospiraceae bacterium]